MATSLEEISTQYPYKTILIPLRTFSEDHMLEFIVEASKGNLDQDLFDDLEVEDKKFLNNNKVCVSSLSCDLHVCIS